MALSRNAQRKIQSTRRGLQALKLREAGCTYKEIAEKMGVSEPRAWQLVSREFDLLLEKRAEKAAHVLKLELARLDEAHKAIYARVQAGNLQAIGAMIQLCERRAKLLGLDVTTGRTAPAASVVTLHIQEIVVNKQEESSDARNGHGQAIPAPSEPTALPAR